MVKHNNYDSFSDTSLYLKFKINVLNACHFTYSPEPDRGQNFRKSLIVSYGVNALQLTYKELLGYHLLTFHKSLNSN